jgi:hypothetical protein
MHKSTRVAERNASKRESEAARSRVLDGIAGGKLNYRHLRPLLAVSTCQAIKAIDKSLARSGR